jgi:hypothetical protein
VPDEKPPIDRALDLFVYAPVGVALYVRDMFPSMMGIFVSRGKREVRSHLGLQEQSPPSPPPVADVARRVGEGVGLARGVAEGGFGLARDITGNALQGLLALRNGGMPAAPRDLDPTAEAPAPDFGGKAPDSDNDTVVPFSYRPPAGGAASSSPKVAVAPDVESLSIPDYDELSASQVIERLEGLDRESLEAIRAYESGHRGRNTILGKIAQLT